MKTALTQLYQAKCYHMVDVFNGDQESVSCFGASKTPNIHPKNHYMPSEKNHNVSMQETIKKADV